MTYKDMTFCNFDACAKFYPSKCDRVLSDMDLKYIRDGNYLVSMYVDKPTCFVERRYEV